MAKAGSSWNWSPTPSASSGRRSSPTARSSEVNHEETSKSLPQPAYLNPTISDDSEPGSVTESQFHTGQRVRHTKFGEGTVIESKLTGNDEEVTVAFPGTGIKRLAASFARLEHVEN